MFVSWTFQSWFGDELLILCGHESDVAFLLELLFSLVFTIAKVTPSEEGH